MTEKSELIAITADITSSFLAHNRVGAQEVARVIQSVYGALVALGAPEDSAPERPQPAVPIRKSVQPDYLVDLFTGKKLKTLKRAIAQQHRMTPAEYRAYWGLPDSYPMVAPNYSETRRAFAKSIGLGRRAGTKILESLEAAATSVISAVTPEPLPSARKRSTPKRRTTAKSSDS